MSVQSIIETLNKLISIHRQLLDLSIQKTEIVKEGQIEKLQSVLVKERKLVQQLEKEETVRHEEVKNWFAQQGLSNDEATMTNLLNHIENEIEKIELEEHAVQLTDLIVKLKQQEQLNLALIHQSMQFVQLSIDLLSPSLKNLNYGDKQQPTVNRSLFDSKA
ncbi:flagellar protein FlgN [Ornithinibacillus halotolerans]|uniref:Flagellar protein FlgN n=1 Tax=Ornithinibacillus halotolerans TaxID=1274357 RepID=A0A916RR48_9BACI|nr:flagellar protein FlgN [Ornithinibacillus halotolerans]GGA67165.1 hypothetical protein GCM10008025_08770 [Ornithinibacillus halotolerans]